MIRLIVLSALVAVAYGRSPHLRSLTPTLDGRIAGGQDTTIQEHPYQVSLQLFETHKCGASLIAANVVVTAARCTAGLSSWYPNFSVRAGSTRHNQGGQVIRVKSVHEHPKFSRLESNDYDCAVVVLRESFDLNESVQLISLQPVNSEISTGVVATVTGWGAVTSGGTSSAILQAVSVPKIGQDTCQSNHPDDSITDRMDCYGNAAGGIYTCETDAGGPLVVDGKLAGIVSWGYGCAAQNLAGVYAKVANEEISSHISDVLASSA